MKVLPLYLAGERSNIMSIELAEASFEHLRADLIRIRPEQLKELEILIELGRKILILSPY